MVIYNNDDQVDGINIKKIGGIKMLKTIIDLVIKLLSGRKKRENKGFITVGEIIPREIKVKLYKMVS